MADNTLLNVGTGGDTIATDDVGPGVKHQLVKVEFGGDGVATMVTTTVGLPTDDLDRALRDVGKVDVAALDQYVPIDVDTGAGTLNAVPITWRKASALGVEFGTSTDPVRVDVTGTTTQPVSAASLPLPTGASTAALQLADGHNVTVDNAAGAAAVNIQDGGNAITVDGTVTANQGTAGTAWEVVGDVASDIAVPANPVTIGGRASDVEPTEVSADGDSVNLWLSRKGAQHVRGAHQAIPTNNFYTLHTPAVNVRATASRAAGAAGVRHVCTGITVVLAADATAPASIALTVELRDGATGAGTIIWQARLSLPATAGATNGISRSDLWFVGSAATAMTLEFSAAGGANTFESCSFESIDLTE